MLPRLFVRPSGFPARALLSFLGGVLLLGSSTAPGSAQVATAVVEENIRSEPNGVILGRISPGTSMAVLSRDGNWAEIDLEGWIWAQSLQTDDRSGFDVVVSASQGENLRGDPQGSILARMERGTLFEELERTPGWIRVRRTVWIWGESLDFSNRPATQPEPETRTAPAPPPLSVMQAPPGGAAILSGPDGDTLARAVGGTDLPVVSREGGWARVRMEGWVWVAAGPSQEALDTNVAQITPADVSADPEGSVGRMVTWSLQFISLESAPAVRTDFYEGEPFLLTRTAGEGQGSFVYVAVPEDRLGEVEGLTPLELIDVVGRIRTGASALTGSPVVDLLELRRGGGPG